MASCSDYNSSLFKEFNGYTRGIFLTDHTEGAHYFLPFIALLCQRLRVPGVCCHILLLHRHCGFRFGIITCDTWLIIIIIMFKGNYLNAGCKGRINTFIWKAPISNLGWDIKHSEFGTGFLYFLLRGTSGRPRLSPGFYSVYDLWIILPFETL
jgi:hypothetical protein